MRKRSSVVWTFALVFAATALSGCLGGDEEPMLGGVTPSPMPTGTAPGPPAPSPSSSPTPTPTETPAPPDPIASLVANRTSGTAPFSVYFALDGSSGVGGILSWSFDADGDGENEAEGTDLPANHTHLYTIPGTYVAALVVYEEDRPAYSNVTIVVHAQEYGDPPAPMRFEGRITGVWVDGYFPEAASHEFELPGPVRGMRVTLSFSETAIDLDIEVFAPDGESAGSSARFNEPTGELPPPFRGPGEPPIDIPGEHLGKTGTWVILVKPALSVDGPYRVDVHFE